LKKKQSVSRLKKLIWKELSQYIRKKAADHRGYAQCITCGVWKPWQLQQGGHFIPGRHNSVIFDERNISVQCYACNVMMHGNPIKYFRFMQQTYGDEVIEELERLDREMKQFTSTELQLLLLHYKELNSKSNV